MSITNSEVFSELSQECKMDLFAKIVNSWKLLFFAKSSILKAGLHKFYLHTYKFYLYFISVLTCFVFSTLKYLAFFKNIFLGGCFRANIGFTSRLSHSVHPKKREQNRNMSRYADIPIGTYLLKIKNWITRARCEICSKLTKKTPERCHWRRFGVFIVNFEHILHLVVVFLLLYFKKSCLKESVPWRRALSYRKQTGFYMIGTSAMKEFSDVFKGCRKKPVAWNELKQFLRHNKVAFKIVNVI